MEEIYKTIDIIIKAQQKARQRNDYNTLLLNSEALLERIPALINYQVEQEAEYRKFEAKLSNETNLEGNTVKRNSSAYCETQAKATDNYKEWQKAKLFTEMIYEMIQLSKKLASSVDKELNAQ